MKFTVTSISLLLLLVTSFSSVGQTQSTFIDSLKNSFQTLKTDVDSWKFLKISGWVQSQFQWTETKGAKTFDGGDFLANSNNRFMIRRGRLKLSYTKGISQFVFQINGTERGLNVVDLFAKISDPWTKAFSLTAGIMNRPFGFEIQQSSKDRETPERSRYNQTLLPNERDMGAMLTFQPVKGKKLYGLKVDAGFYNGTGITVPGTTSLNGAGVVDFDSYKDFIGRAHYLKNWKEDKITLGLGVSHYNGGFVYQSNQVYSTLKMDSVGQLSWLASDTTNGKTYLGKKAPRVYYGGDFQFSVKSKLGKTAIRGEYITGTQTGTMSELKSPSSLPSNPVAVVRKFNGGYAYLIHRIGKTKHEIALKYEWFDPNSELTGSAILQAKGFTKAELKYTMLGLGYNYYVNDNVKFMLHYNVVMNERAKDLVGYTEDIKDNVLTFRVQYQF
jgi:phosphate-selective porin